MRAVVTLIFGALLAASIHTASADNHSAAAAEAGRASGAAAGSAGSTHKAHKHGKTAPVKAEAPAVDPAQVIFQKLTTKFPNTHITSISKSPMKGLYEVVMGKNIAYVDETASLFLFGHMFDMETQQDLTQARVDELTKVDFKKLPFDKAIKVVKGDGSRVFAVFSDPDCPYCQRLETDLAGVDNYTMYVFMFPIEQLHPEAPAHATAIWCAKDRGAAWHAFLTSHKLPGDETHPPKMDCATPIAELQALGQSLGVNGTPTLVRPDGKILPGAPGGAAGMDEFLNAAAKLATAAPAANQPKQVK